MKKNKYKYIGLASFLLISMAGCTPKNANMRNMQTRLNDNQNNGFMTDISNNDRLNPNLNNGMVRNQDFMNDEVRNGKNLNGNLIDDLNNGVITNDKLNTEGNLSTRAQKIEKKISELPEVNTASVVIHGNTALVGCDVRGNDTLRGTTTNIVGTTGTLDSNLKKKIEAAVKVVDKDIKNVSITSDTSLYNRIKKVNTNITNGNPISNFVGEIEDVLSNILTPSKTR